MIIVGSNVEEYRCTKKQGKGEFPQRLYPK